MTKRFMWLLLFLLTVACYTNGDEKTIPTATSAVSKSTENPINNTGAINVQEESQPVTIHFAIYDRDLNRYEALVEEFEKDNPEYNVRLVSIDETLGLKPGGIGWPDDAYSRLAAAADLWSVGASREAVRQGLALDLTPLLAVHNFDLNDLYPGALNQSQWNSGIWTFPTEITYDLIYFNKEAFDEAGVDYPQPGWTWDDFLVTAKSLTEQGEDKTTQWGFAQFYLDALPFVHGQAGLLFNPNTTPPEARLNTPAMIEAVEWYTNLFLTHQVAPRPSSFNSTSEGESFIDGFQLVLDGSAAMWIDRSPSWSYWNQQLDIGVAPFPISTQRSGTTPAHRNEFSISAGTKYPDAAWRLLAFLSQQPPNQTNSGILPSRPSVAEASGFWNHLDKELAMSLDYAVDHAFWSTYIEGGADGYAAFFDAIIAILDGKEMVTEALTRAQSEAEAALERTQLELEQNQATPAPPVVVVESEDETNAAEYVTTIQFMVGDSPGSLQLYRELVTQFQAENPDIVIELRQPNLVGGSVTLANLAADADCFQWFPDLNDEKALEAVLSLEPLINVDSSISKDNFFPFILNQFTHQGQLYGLPGDIFVPVIEFNKDLFDAAGMDYPGLDWTTDDFLNIAIALTSGEGENKQYGFVPDIYEGNDMLNMLQRRGANMLDKTMGPSGVSFTDQTTLEAMRWYISLTTEHGIKPIFITTVTGSSLIDLEQRRDLIENGRAAMWTNSDFSGIGEISINRHQPNIGVVPLPAETINPQMGGYQFARGYFISANTQARQACWQWITFLTGQNSIISGLPARRDVAESPAFQQQMGHERAAAFLHGIEHSGQAPFFQNITGENSWLSTTTIWLIAAYDQILSDGISVEEALDKAQLLADEYRSCVIVRDGYTNREAQQGCLQEVDTSLSE